MSSSKYLIKWPHKTIADFYKLSNLPFGKMEYQTFDMMTGVHLLPYVQIYTELTIVSKGWIELTSILL